MKKNGLAQILAHDENPKFLSNQANVQAILPIHELVILIKFHMNWQEIVDFLVIVTFRASSKILHAIYVAGAVK